MPRIALGLRSEWKEGEGRSVTLAPAFSAYVFCYKGQMRAFMNRCTHMGAPVELVGDRCVCTQHHAEFSAETGERLEGEAPEGSSLTPLTLQEEDGNLVLVWSLPRDPFAL